MSYLLPKKPFDKQKAEYITETHTHTPPVAHMVIFNCLFSVGAYSEETINSQLASWPVRGKTVTLRACLQPQEQLIWRTWTQLL